jgi:hypothetical protein
MYSGERDAKPLIKWLNEQPKTRRAKRVHSVLSDLINFAQEHEPEAGLGGAVFRPDDFLKIFNDILRRMPNVELMPAIQGVADIPSPRITIVYRAKGRAGEFNEDDALLRATDLLGQAWLGRVRRCQCGLWFFARIATQRFHCSVCQRQHQQTSEVFRAKRRNYMRDYRRVQKRNVR